MRQRMRQVRSYYLLPIMSKVELEETPSISFIHHDVIISKNLMRGDTPIKCVDLAELPTFVV